MMKKVLQVASVASMIDQFNMGNIEVLQMMGYKVDIAANFEFGNTSSQERTNEFKKELQDSGIKIFNLLFDRKVINRTNINAYKELRKIIKENNYEIIHCHSPIGGVITRLAAISARKKNTKVIYTGHGFHFFKGAPIINWLIYYPIELICSFFTDTLITMNKEDYNIAKKKMKASRIEYINGIGIDTQKYNGVNVDKENTIDNLGIPKGASILLSVGELSKRKNHEIVIKALAKINNKNIYYIICGKGPLEEELKNLCKELNVENNVIFMGFRMDIAEICKISDIYLFPSLQEGLPVALMEAMAAGLPCIVSKIRGNIDLIEDEKGGLLIDKYDIDGYSEAINRLINNKVLCEKMGIRNFVKIREFDRENVNKRMFEIYKEVLHSDKN